MKDEERKMKNKKILFKRRIPFKKRRISQILEFEFEFEFQSDLSLFKVKSNGT